MSASTNSSLLLDTTVLVDVLRGHAGAAAFVEAARGKLAVSSLTVAEIYAGTRGDEALPVGRLMGLFTVLPVTNAIGQLGGAYRHEFGRRSGTGLINCLIAATAQLHGLQLATANLKHFPMLDDVRHPYR
jgi:predicted nucleic acid-binding protein